IRDFHVTGVQTCALLILVDGEYHGLVETYRDGILVVLLLHQNAVSVCFHKAVVLTVYQGSDFQWPPLRIELTVWAMTTAVYVMGFGNELAGLVLGIGALMTHALHPALKGQPALFIVTGVFTVRLRTGDVVLHPV